MSLQDIAVILTLVAQIFSYFYENKTKVDLAEEALDEITNLKVADELYSIRVLIITADYYKNDARCQEIVNKFMFSTSELSSINAEEIFRMSNDYFKTQQMFRAIIGYSFASLLMEYNPKPFLDFFAPSEYTTEYNHLHNSRLAWRRLYSLKQGEGFQCVGLSQSYIASSIIKKHITNHNNDILAQSWSEVIYYMTLYDMNYPLKNDLMIGAEQTVKNLEKSFKNGAVRYEVYGWALYMQSITHYSPEESKRLKSKSVKALQAAKDRWGVEKKLKELFPSLL